MVWYCLTLATLLTILRLLKEIFLNWQKVGKTIGSHIAPYEDQNVGVGSYFGDNQTMFF